MISLLDKPRIVGAEAMNFGGWQRLNADYAQQFGIETPKGPPQAAQEQVAQTLRLSDSAAFHLKRCEKPQSFWEAKLCATHFVTLGEQDALAEGGYVVLVGVPDPLRARLQRRSP